MRVRWIVVAGIIAVLTTGCSGRSASDGESTLTGEDVIRTAEAIAAATLQAATPIPTSIPVTPTDTEIPITDTPMPTATPSVPIAVSLYNANVRSGPGESYGVIDFFMEGAEAQITGQYLDDQSMSWLYLERIGEGKDGWIFYGSATIYGDIDTVPFLVIEDSGN
ncbi:MAG: SH3 domain-containing protein [Anaerolineales bacterium]|nr:SH3 domain-containing protein [Anaerolineales bacterium]